MAFYGDRLHVEKTAHRQFFVFHIKVAEKKTNMIRIRSACFFRFTRGRTSENTLSLKKLDPELLCLSELLGWFSRQNENDRSNENRIFCFSFCIYCCQHPLT